MRDVIAQLTTTDNRHDLERRPSRKGPSGPAGKHRLLEMGIQGDIAAFLDGPNGSANKKLLKNIFVFGLAIVVLYNYEAILGPLDEVPEATAGAAADIKI